LLQLTTAGSALNELDWVVTGAQEGLTEEEAEIAAGAWRSLSARGERAELLALLAAAALPALTPSEHGAVVAQVGDAPDAWRVGVAVTLVVAAHRSARSAMVEELAGVLEGYARGGKLAVAATVGLLQLIRTGAIGPKAPWMARVRAAIPSPVSNDPRVLRELDRVG